MPITKQVFCGEFLLNRPLFSKVKPYITHIALFDKARMTVSIDLANDKTFDYILTIGSPNIKIKNFKCNLCSPKTDELLFSYKFLEDEKSTVIHNMEVPDIAKTRNPIGILFEDCYDIIKCKFRIEYEYYQTKHDVYDDFILDPPSAIYFNNIKDNLPITVDTNGNQYNCEFIDFQDNTTRLLIKAEFKQPIRYYKILITNENDTFIYNKMEQSEPVSAYDSFMTVEHLESMLSESEKERYKCMHSFVFKIVPLKDEFIGKLKVHVEAFYKEDKGN